MSQQKFNHPSCKVLYTGASGTGKTTLFAKRVKEEKAWLKFVYDHQGEFASRFKIPAVTDVDGLTEKTAKGGWIVFDPVAVFPGKSQEGFNFFCDYAFAVCQQFGGESFFVAMKYKC